MDWPKFQKRISLTLAICFPLLLVGFFVHEETKCFLSFLYASPTNWPIRTHLCAWRDPRAERACSTGSSDYVLSARCALARDSCISMWLLALRGLLGLNDSDSLSEEVTLSVTLLFIHPLSCFCYNSTLHKI